MDPTQERRLLHTRRHFFGLTSKSIGTAALASLLGKDLQGAATGGLSGLPHHPPKAKPVNYLFQHGAPSHLGFFHSKPLLTQIRGSVLPESVRMGQTLTGMSPEQHKVPTPPS